MREFWDERWQSFSPAMVEVEKFREEAEASEAAFMDLVGDVRGLEILELGCGTGLFSVCFAKMGARVTAIDNSPEAVRKTRLLCECNGVDESVNVMELDARDLGSLKQRFDLVVGRFVLHHIEPFEPFAVTLAGLIRNGGRGIFLENNARNPLLMLFRKYLVGRFGIPKYGDAEERPFDPREIGILKRSFDYVSVTYPEFMCFQLAGSYVFRDKKAVTDLLKKIDGWTYKHLPALSKYSYRQLIEVAHRG